MNMNYAVKVTTGGKRGGVWESRMGWLVYSAGGGLRTFVDAAGRGEQALQRDFREPVMVLCAVPVTPTYFRECQDGIDHPYYDPDNAGEDTITITQDQLAQVILESGITGQQWGEQEPPGLSAGLADALFRKLAGRPAKYEEERGS
jgi:hypothetical protein